MAKKETILSMLLYLDQAFEHVTGDATVAVYADGLSDIADEKLLEAARVAVKQCKYFPRVAELRTIASGVRAEGYTANEAAELKHDLRIAEARVQQQKALANDNQFIGGPRRERFRAELKRLTKMFTRGKSDDEGPLIITEEEKEKFKRSVEQIT